MAVALVTAGCGGTTTAGPGGTSTGASVLDVPLTPLAGGSASTLRSQLGKPTVVNLWASWCAPCRTEMPQLEEVHQRLGDQVNFVGVTDDLNLDAAKGIARDTGVTYPLFQDASGAVLTQFGVVNLPATIILDRDGRVVERRLGKVSGEDVNAALAPLLASSGSASTAGAR